MKKDAAIWSKYLQNAIKEEKKKTNEMDAFLEKQKSEI